MQNWLGGLFRKCSPVQRIKRNIMCDVLLNLDVKNKNEIYICQLFVELFLLSKFAFGHFTFLCHLEIFFAMFATCIMTVSKWFILV